MPCKTTSNLPFLSAELSTTTDIVSMPEGICSTGHARVFQNREHLAHEAYLRVHQRLFDKYYGKILFASNACDYASAGGIVDAGLNERAVVFGAEGVFDMNGYVGLAHGEDGSE